MAVVNQTDAKNPADRKKSMLSTLVDFLLRTARGALLNFAKRFRISFSPDVSEET
jgi:hypothetical protein